MNNQLDQKIKGYHYTNLEAYKSMQTPGIDGWISDFDEFTGLAPSKRFLMLGRGKNLPYEAHNSVIEGVLEPEPLSWTSNPEFPNLWRRLMHDICRKDEIVLLSFEFEPTDQAYVVERAHIEKELYRASKNQGKPTTESMNEASKKYWNSRIPVSEYQHNYTVPQLAIWSGIEKERLQVEWKKPVDEVWNEVLNNNW
jgi:hypothetical protein